MSVSTSATIVNGMTMSGLSTIGMPKVRGSLIVKIWGPIASLPSDLNC